MPTSEEILELVVDAGDVMLNNGAEINRVQQTMEIMAHSFGAEGFHVYVLTNGLFATIDGERQCTSAVRHVPSAGVHLGRVAAVNALSRGIADGSISFAQAKQHVAQIRVKEYIKPLTQILACAVGTATFCFLFGGTWWDALAALFTGVALGAFQLIFRRYPAGKLITNLLCAMVVVAVSVALVQLGLGQNLNYVIISCIFPLVPGIVLTTSIRDFANSDYLSGTIRLIDSVLVAASIALGVGIVLKLVSVAWGVVL